MPHIPLLELRPEATGDPDDPQDTVDNVELKAEDTDEANAGNWEANTTFHDLEAERTGGNNGLVQRVKRFISKKKAKGRNITAGRIRHGTVEDDNMRYGYDESSDSDNEGDQHDGIPLVRRNKRT